MRPAVSISNHDEGTATVPMVESLSPSPKNVCEHSNKPIQSLLEAQFIDKKQPDGKETHTPDKLHESAYFYESVEPLRELQMNCGVESHMHPPLSQSNGSLSSESLDSLKRTQVGNTPVSHTTADLSSMTNHQTRPSGRAKCQHCSKEYAYRSGLAKHIKKNTAKKQSVYHQEI